MILTPWEPVDLQPKVLLNQRGVSACVASRPEGTPIHRKLAQVKPRTIL